MRIAALVRCLLALLLLVAVPAAASAAPLEEVARLSERVEGGALAWDGSRLLLVAGAEVRAIDPTSGAVSLFATLPFAPPGPGAFHDGRALWIFGGDGRALRVDADGRATEAPWRFQAEGGAVSVAPSARGAWILSGPELLTFEPALGAPELFAALPKSREGAVVAPATEDVLVLGGAGSERTILRVDLMNGAVREADGSIAESCCPAGASDGERVFLLGGGGSRTIQAHDPVADYTSIMGARLPVESTRPAAVWNGTRVLAVVGDRVVAYDASEDWAIPPMEETPGFGALAAFAAAFAAARRLARRMD